MTTRATMRIPRNGQISRIISFNGIWLTALITNNKIPYGGVIKPIIELTTIRTPKWIRSIPNALQVGMNSGTITRIMTVASSTQPSKRTSRFTQQEGQRADIDPDKTSEIIIGTFSWITTYIRIIEAPITTPTDAADLALATNTSYKVMNLRVRYKNAETRSA